jgi:ketosteroid isomerase-like protein
MSIPRVDKRPIGVRHDPNDRKALRGAAIMTMRTPTPYAEAQVRQRIADRERAIAAKDVDRIQAHYHEDVVLLDVKPPYRTVGIEELRRVWDSALPCLADSFQVETRDLRIVLSGDVAVEHRLFRLGGLPECHSAGQTWIRGSAVWHKDQGRWRIVHDHWSVPFDPQTSRAVLTLEA